METSVVCPVFNTPASILLAAVRSVLGQTGSHGIELILVDDCSTDPATLAAFRTAAGDDGRVRVLHQTRNAGPAQARTHGIAAAAYDWIGFIDSDDLWPQGKLNQAEGILREWTDSRWISGGFTMLMPGGTLRPSRPLTTHCPPAVRGRNAQRLHPPGTIRALVGAWHPLGSSLFRKDLIAAAGGFEPSLLYGEDWLFCLRASTLAPIDFVETSTYVLRRQGASLMRSPARLTSKLMHSVTMAQRDPALRVIRRELRWFRYATYKDMAMNIALNGRKLRAAGFAARALLADPSGIREFLYFLRHLHATGPALARSLGRYSTAEQVDLSQVEELG